MEDSILSAYSEARTEYMRQLLMHISPVYFNFFLKLYDNAKDLTQHDTKKRLWQFQTLLAEIPDWNMERVRTETTKIEKDCDCDYLEDLLTAVFLAYTKVLTAIRLNTKNKRVNITIPKIDHFLFKALCETSKILWQNTFLFREDVSNLQRQQNYREVEKLINEGITQTVRTMTPVRSILKDCITDIEDHDDTQSKINAESNPSETNQVIQENSQFPNMNEVIQQVDEIQPVQEDSTVKQEAGGQEDSTVNQETAVQEDSTVNQETVEQDKVIDVSEKEPSVKFTNFNTVYTIDEPENTDIKYSDPDLESVNSFETDNSEGSLEFEDDDSNSIDADVIDDDKSVEALSMDDFSTLDD
jgi:hypothetical protein